MLIIVLMMTRFFPLFQAKLFTGKLGSQEISNFIPPCVQFTLESQKIGATEPEKLEMTAKFKDDIKTELVGTLEDEAKRFKEDADDSPSSKMRSRT